MLTIKRIYDEPAAGDGYRVLVDRLWPRGVAKDRAKIDLWMKEIAPGDELRKWFSHDPERWDEFRKRYREELNGRQEELEKLRRIVREHAVVTLLFAAKDELHNNAAALREMI